MIHMPYAGFAVFSIALTITFTTAAMVPLDALMRDSERSRDRRAPRDPLALILACVAVAAALLSFSMLYQAAYGGDTRAVETVDGPYALVDPGLFGAVRDSRNPYRVNLYLERPDGTVERVSAHVDDLRIVRDADAETPFVEVAHTGTYHEGSFLFIEFEGSLDGLDETEYRIHLQPGATDVWTKGE